MPAKNLANAAAVGECELFYWREGNQEVDFVVRVGRTLTAIEVKSGRIRDGQPGLTAFTEAFKPARKLLVGGDGIPVEEFLLGNPKPDLTISPPSRLARPVLAAKFELAAATPRTNEARSPLSTPIAPQLVVALHLVGR